MPPLLEAGARQAMSIIKFLTEENPAACCGVLQFFKADSPVPSHQRTPAAQRFSCSAKILSGFYYQGMIFIKHLHPVRSLLCRKQPPYGVRLLPIVQASNGVYIVRQVFHKQFLNIMIVGICFNNLMSGKNSLGVLI